MEYRYCPFTGKRIFMIVSWRLQTAYIGCTSLRAFVNLVCLRPAVMLESKTAENVFITSTFGTIGHVLRVAAIESNLVGGLA